MITVRDGHQHANVVDFPTAIEHSAELVIEEYDNWRNPELVGGVFWSFSTRWDDQAEAA